LSPDRPTSSNEINASPKEHFKRAVKGLVSNAKKTLRARPQRSYDFFQAASVLEARVFSKKHSHPNIDDDHSYSLLSPKEWTLSITCWGAAGRPDKALEALRRVEAVMERAEGIESGQQQQQQQQQQQKPHNKELNFAAGAAAARCASGGVGAAGVNVAQKFRPKALYGAAVMACCCRGV
jgi:hypothetical protein